MSASETTGTRDRALAAAAVLLGSILFGWQCAGGNEVGPSSQAAA